VKWRSFFEKGVEYRGEEVQNIWKKKKEIFPNIENTDSAFLEGSFVKHLSLFLLRRRPASGFLSASAANIERDLERLHVDRLKPRRHFFSPPRRKEDTNLLLCFVFRKKNRGRDYRPLRTRCRTPL
jgi:hypothetical protein